ncbi:hypothetical protein ABER98_01695 [Domibacillus aminovorans]|uniref:phage late control D family protein n=1 Tax=Domibacillus aminovorans TaxID=29332 RepID=UPI003D1AE809
MKLGRHIKPDVIYNKQNISLEIEDFIDSISFQDNLSGQADNITVSLADREKRWITKHWAPHKGDSLSIAMLLSRDWISDQPTARNLGDFEIDEITMNGPPTKMSVKGISIPQNTALKEKKTKAWEKTNLKKIAEEMAKNSKLSLYFSVEENPEYDRIDQDDQSDTAFLDKMCSDAGLSLKIANKKIIILDEAQLEKEDAVTTISRTDKDLKDYSGKDTLSVTYKSCQVKYTDTKKKKTIKYTFTPEKPPATGRVLIVNEEVTSEAEAIKVAKKSLRNANKEAKTFSLRLAGFLFLYAGQCINLKEFGVFDGKYIITSMSGAVGNGSETSLELRSCLEGY